MVSQQFSWSPLVNPNFSLLHQMHHRPNFITLLTILPSIKLNRDNYLLWKVQLVPFLPGQSLFSFVDGSTSCPLQYFNLDSASRSMVANTDYQTWYHQVKMMLSAFISSLSEGLLPHVLGLKCG
jgi:hypothetical protein